MKPFDKLPKRFDNEYVKEYYDILSAKKATLIIKRLLDFVFALLLLTVLLPIIIILALLVVCSSKGPALFLQTRVGKYGKEFKIIKFRTMIVNAEKVGKQITVGERDSRITHVGNFLRKFRLDEFPQLINVLFGDMSFVGARPEVPAYVDKYTDEMMATLLLEPGITGYASIEFKDENAVLAQGEDPEQKYINEILPEKMKLNLDYIKKLSLLTDTRIILKTISVALFG